MKTSTKRIVKWFIFAVSSLVVIALAIGGYIYSLIPKPLGPIPELQEELFRPTLSSHGGKFAYQNATDLAADIRNKKVSSVEVVQDVIGYIKQNNYKYNALVWLFEEKALAEAKKADSLLALGIVMGPLHGVPMTVKEQFFVENAYCTLNAKMVGGFKPEKDQALITQLRKAGAIIIGTTNVPYMLMDYQTYGEIYPPASNPYDTTRTPGGSTGGGAAALAAGFVPLELGGDMGGSVRAPAAYCGLYGLKTTEKALDLWDADFPGYDFDKKYSSLAVAGPLARTPEDIELIWKVLKETPNQFSKHISYLYDSSKTLDQYKIAYTDHLKIGGKLFPSNRDIRQNIETLISRLEGLGTQTTDTIPATFDDQFVLFMALMGCMNTSGQPWLMRQLIMQGFKEFDDGSIDLSRSFDLATSLDQGKWQDMEALRKKTIQTWDSFFDSYDFLITPVMPTEAIKKCPRGTPIPLDGSTVGYWQAGSFSLMVNATGHPAITIPLGLNKQGLPISVQIVGKYYSEPQLIRLAKQLEEITPGFIRPANSML